MAEYLLGEEAPGAYVERVAARDADYPGYNLIAGDRDGLVYHSNRSGETRALGTGVYGLSNHLLDTPWPKVERSKAGLLRLLERDGAPLLDGLLDLLADHARPADHELPDTGIGLEWERLLAAAFIASESYGTRSSSVLLLARDGAVIFVEQAFGRGGERLGRVRHEIAAAPRADAHARRLAMPTWGIPASMNSPPRRRKPWRS